MPDNPIYRAALEAAAEWLRQEGKKRRNDAKGLAGEERAYAVVSGMALEAVAFDVENLPVPSLRETLDLDAGLDAVSTEMQKHDRDVPSWREFDEEDKVRLRDVLRAGILSALGVKE